jgi:hypothetical protein
MEILPSTPMARGQRPWAGTLSHWCWHNFPLPLGVTISPTITGPQTGIIHCSDNQLEVSRVIDDSEYQVALTGDAFAVAPGAARNQFIVTANAGAEAINPTCHFGITAATDPSSMRRH